MAVAVHGFLVFGHALGLLYNARKCRDSRRNRLDVAIHAAALGYSLRAVAHHLAYATTQEHTTCTQEHTT